MSGRKEADGESSALAFPVASSNTTVPTLSPAESTVLNSSYQSMDRRLDEHTEWCTLKSDAEEVSGSPSLPPRSSCKQLEGIRHSAKAKDGRTDVRADDDGWQKGEGRRDGKAAPSSLSLQSPFLRLSFSFPLPMEGGRRVGSAAWLDQHTTPPPMMPCAVTCRARLSISEYSNLPFLQLLYNNVMI